MAGDWIKMRGELWTHPRFIALSNMLIYCDKDEHHIGMLVYACGWDALQLDVFPPNNENVTDKALRGVTKKALRDVTMCALLRVWCAVNSHCKVQGVDAVCSPMGLSDLDEIAGFEGFGEALEVVGWVISEESSDSLIFPNFVEFNEPAILRKKPAKSNAERQAEFRQRKAEKECVTKSNESNAREEKRREDKSIRKTKIVLLDDGTFEGLESHLPVWENAYPSLDVNAQIRKAGAWCKSNAKRAPKSDYPRFLNSWLSRANENVSNDDPFAGAI
jgi:hypothetical protein